jgi:tetratricopeptide (TPR) repeat protein
MSTVFRSLVFTVGVCLSGSAVADDAPSPTPAPASGFKDTYDRGTAHFNAKEFAKARIAYLAAYDMQPDPTILFAIAQTYRYEGNYKEAIDWYKKFLADSQAAQDLRTEAQSYLSESETRQKALDDAKKKAAESGPKEPDGRPATVATPNGAQVSPPGPVDQGERKRRIPLGSKIAAGVTGVGLISALVFTKLGLDAEKDVKLPGATDEDADKVERYQNLINISWGVTGAAAITAVVIYFAAPSYSTDSRNVVIAPNRDGGWSAAFTKRF